MPPKKLPKRQVAEFNQAEVAEREPVAMPEISLESALAEKAIAQQAQNALNVGKIRRALKMLENGLSVEQVGRELRLSIVEVEQLALDAEDVEPAVEVESFDAWKARAAERLAKKTVGMMERHLDGVAQMVGEGGGVLGPETMSTVKDASAINYLWLKKGDEKATGRVSVDFTVLANAQRPLGNGTPAIEVRSDPA